MSKDYKAIIGGIGKNLGAFGKLQPDVMGGFRKLGDAATEDGTLDEKTKEFVALAIGVTQRCDGCIGFHAKALAELGATREEVAEVLGVCVYMGGGPALMYVADALDAFDQFSEK